MQLQTTFTGTPLRDHTVTVTSRATMNYAAAIDDANPRYLDDAGGKAIIAPPMFAVAATWPVSERIHAFLVGTDFPREVLQTQVHYSEHLAFHRPLRPGDALVIRGRIAAIVPHRAGTVTVLRFDACDRDGAPVFTEHTGALLRGVACVGEGRGAEDLPVTPAPPAPDAGASACWEESVHIDRLKPFVYDGCTNIHFPIHTSVGFARMVGLPDIILQGTATLAYAARALTDREAGGDATRLKAITCRFSGMLVPPGDLRIRLSCRRERADGADLFFAVDSGSGRLLTHGYALVGG